MRKGLRRKRWKIERDLGNGMVGIWYLIESKEGGREREESKIISRLLVHEPLWVPFKETRNQTGRAVWGLGRR